MGAVRMRLQTADKNEHLLNIYLSSGLPRRWVGFFFLGKDLEKGLMDQWILCSEWVPSEWESKQLIKTITIILSIKQFHGFFLCFLQTHIFSLHNMLIERLEWCGLLVDYWDVFISCFGLHSPQRIYWWASNAMLHFSKSDEETNSSTS